MKKSMSCRRWMFRILAITAAGLSFQCTDENPLAPDVRGENEVWITANGFQPTTLTVTAGTTVTWINKDNSNHTVDSGAPNMPENLFSSPTIRPNGTFSFKFDNPGSYNYYCAQTLATGRIVVN